MTRKPVRMLGVAALAVLAGCVTYNPVPLRDGGFPRGALQVGDDVRATTRAGETLSFEVANVEGSTLTTDEGERVDADELTSLRVGRLNKRRTFVTLGVVGGVIGTAIALDAIDDDIEDCFDFDFDDDCESD